MNHHHTDVSGRQRGDKGYWYAYCLTCGTRTRYESRVRAREAADAHQIFTHLTGGSECGSSGCVADRTIRRRRRANEWRP